MPQTPEVREALQNYSFSEALHSGFLRRVGALLDNGPVREDLEGVINTVRDLELAWEKIWNVVHARIVERSGEPDSYPSRYEAELRSYAKDRDQRVPERTPYQVLDPAYLDGLIADLPESEARNRLSRFRSAMDFFADQINTSLRPVIRAVESKRAGRTSDLETALSYFDAVKPAGLGSIITGDSGLLPIRNDLGTIVPALGSAELNELALSAMYNEEDEDDQDVAS